MTFQEEMEVAAFRAFRRSVNNSLKEFLQNGIKAITSGFEGDILDGDSKERLIELLTLQLTYQLEWRCQYEMHLQYANCGKIYVPEIERL